MVPLLGYVVGESTLYVVPLAVELKRTNGEPGRRDSDSSYPSVPPWMAFLIRYWVATFSGLTQVAMVMAPAMSREALSPTVA